MSGRIYSREDCIEAMRAAAKDGFITYAQYRQSGRLPSTNTIRVLFGSWAGAMKAAGIKSPAGGPKVVETTERECLKCDDLFASEGPHNRVCDRCQKINEKIPEPMAGFVSCRATPASMRDL